MANLIYIGNLDPMDTIEKNYTNEDPSAVQGEYSAADMQNVEVKMSDNFTPGFTYDDDMGYEPDDFGYDLGSGAVTSGLDAQAVFVVKVQESDGSVSIVKASVYQTQSGDTFLRLPNGMEVERVSIGEMIGDGYDHITTDSGSSSTVVCFAAGTRIATPEGAQPVEQLEVGDLVMTLDNGPQPICWHHRWTTRTTSKTAPVRIPGAMLGDGLPGRDLCVSPQHRVLLSSKVAQRMFGDAEVLIPARLLVGFGGITQDVAGRSVNYVHFRCERHEIVWSEGICSETMLLGQQTVKVLRSYGLKPQSSELGAQPARALQSPQRLRRLIWRHQANQRAFEVPQLRPQHAALCAGVS